MLLTPLVATDEVAWRLMALRRGRRRGRVAPLSGHVLLLGAGSTGMPLLEDLVLSGTDVVVVDDDPAIVRRLEEAGIPSIRGEASDPLVLREAGADGARVVVSTIRRPRDNAALLELAAEVPVLVRTFDEQDADWIRERGGRPILYSEATADGLLRWFRGETP
jgi:CPA2 family monovalent cation:H+ antiporter-2